LTALKSLTRTVFIIAGAVSASSQKTLKSKKKISVKGARAAAAQPGRID
jgi:hypothetical protein